MRTCGPSPGGLVCGANGQGPMTSVRSQSPALPHFTLDSTPHSLPLFLSHRHIFQIFSLEKPTGLLVRYKAGHSERTGCWVSAVSVEDDVVPDLGSRPPRNHTGRSRSPDAICRKPDRAILLPVRFHKQVTEMAGAFASDDSPVPPGGRWGFPCGQQL